MCLVVTSIIVIIKRRYLPRVVVLDNLVSGDYWTLIGLGPGQPPPDSTLMFY